MLAMKVLDRSWGMQAPEKPTFKLLQTTRKLREMLVQCHEVG